MIRWTLLPLVALMGCAASTQMQSSEAARADRALADALAGRTAGAPQECISTGFTSGPQIIDSHTILYRETGRTVWRNDLIGPCPSLAPGETVSVEISGGELCHNDHLRVIPFSGGIPSAPCRLGQFVPYRK